MAKKYSFEFPGTKEMFMNTLTTLPNYKDRCFYFDDYIIELSESEIRFGVSRGGHSGGYWFIPTITEANNKTTFHGEIQYIGIHTHEKGFWKVMDLIEEFFLTLILLPIILIIKLCLWVVWLVRKIRKCPKPKEETTEDRLFRLMETYLNCSRT